MDVCGTIKCSIRGPRAHVSATFGAQNDISRDTPTVPSATTKTPSSTNAGPAVTAIKTPATTDAGPAVTAIPTRHGRQLPYVKGITCENQKDRESRLKYIKAQITAQFWTLDVKWRSDHLFPWKNMISELAKAGVMLYNWPEDCRFPGTTPKESNKGIAELTAPEQASLINALVADPHRLYFVLLEDEDKKRDLRTGKRAVIFGIPPPPSSTRERGLQVFVGGKFNYYGSKRRTEEEAMIEDVEVALKGKKAAGTEDPKHKRTTRRSAKAKVAEPCPNPTHDDIEDVLINGDPVDPRTKAKAKKKARISSKPYIELSEDDGVVGNPADASPPGDTTDASLPVVSAKTRVKRRAAKKAIVEPSDDEDEVIKLQKDPGASKAKRKQTDTADETVTSGHQPKRPRPTPRQASTTDADNGEADSLENDIFNRASGRAGGKNKAPSRVGNASERPPKASDERAPVTGSERHPTQSDVRPSRVSGERALDLIIERAHITNKRAPVDENERAHSGDNETALPPGDETAPTAPTPKDTRHRVVDGERALITNVERAPIIDERAPTDEYEKAPITDDARHRSGNNEGSFPCGDSERAPPPGDERATTSKDASLRTVEDEVVRTLVANTERAPDMVAQMVKDKEAIDTTDPQPPAMAAATPTGRTAPAYLPLPTVQNVGWPAGGPSYPPSSLLLSPNPPATRLRDPRVSPFGPDSETVPEDLY